MSSYPLVKFVDAIGGSIRLDLNDRSAAAPRGVEATIDLGGPTIEGDPDSVGQAFGFRTMSLTVQIKGTKANALAFVQALSKEIQRRTNWLLFQLDASTAPRWFKTYRTSYQPLSLEQVYANSTTGGNAPAGYPDVWRFEVPLLAESHSYGARVNISTGQVIQAPADLTGPTRGAMHYVLPAIKGDAPTPLRVTLTPDLASGNNLGTGSSSAWLVGCVAGAATMTDPIIDIGTGDTVTNINGTAAASTDATYFGGSYRTVTIAAAVLPATNLLTRFRLQTPNTIPLGRYKVLLRCRYTVTGTGQTFIFRLEQWPNSLSADAVLGRQATQAVGVAETGRNFWVDLGEISLPFGVNPPTDVTGTMPTGTLAVEIGTASGVASSLNVDALKLIPIDGPLVTRATLIKALGPSVGWAYRSSVGSLDGDAESAWATSAVGVFVDATPQLSGGFPVADPAASQNLLVVMALDAGANGTASTSISSLNAQSAVDVSYYPRYLHIGDGT